MRKFLNILLILAITLSSASCLKKENPFGPDGKYERVAIFAGFAYNNLSSDVRANIRDVAASPLPMIDDDKALVLFMHHSVNDTDFSTLTSPCIIRVTSGWNGIAKLDTIKTFPAGSRMTDAAIFKEGMEFIAKTFPSDHYGLLLSSHGTGWLPEGYYDSPGSFKTTLRTAPGPQPYVRHLRKANEPKVKSFGCEAEHKGAKVISHEMTLDQLDEAIPIHLDYLVFDACLMGGIETACALQDKADRIVFSQTEILSSGFNMKPYTTRLLASATVDLEGFCEDYYQYYNKQSGTYKSATISLVDCSAIPALESLCKVYFDKYGDGIKNIDATEVQRYYRGAHPWFYDFEDILLKAGMTKDDREILSAALNRCILFKRATESFMEAFNITSHSGLSMYIPYQNGNGYLDSYYKTTRWNKATELVK